MKKLITKKHVFLIYDISEDYIVKDIIHGKSVLLSVYVSENIEKNTLSGQYSFIDSKVQIAKNDDVIEIVDPTDKEISFFNLLKEKKNINYSRKLANDYDINKYIIKYEIENDA